MTDKEKMMYEIIGKISSSDIPIVFKGGLVTKLILLEKGFNGIERTTKDIDANWIEKPPSMSSMTDSINTALGDLRERFIAEPSREYGEGRSAGFKLKDKKTDEVILSMDIDIKSLIGSKTYFYGEIAFKGVLANEIIADKVSAMSTDAIFKHRTKDIVDVFALSHCVNISTQEIYELCKKMGREINSFYAFYERKADIEHAYNMLKGIEGKPPFTEVYCYLEKFVEPFAIRNAADKIWSADKVSWQEVKEKLETMEDWKKQIKEMKEKGGGTPKKAEKTRDHKER